MQARKAFHSSLNNKTVEVLQSIANRQGINQGRVIDYIVQLYLDQLVRDNDEILQAVKLQFEYDREQIKTGRQKHMKRIRGNKPASQDNSQDNDALTGIF